MLKYYLNNSYRIILFSTLPALPRSYQLPYPPYFMFSFLFFLAFKIKSGQTKFKMNSKNGKDRVERESICARSEDWNWGTFGCKPGTEKLPGAYKGALTENS